MAKLEKLYVIGNGFDVWHNLPTSYKCYNCYMCMEHPDVHERVGHIFNRQNANMLWSNYENMLPQVDIVSLVRRNIDRWISMSKEDLENTFDELDSDIKCHFQDWVNQINHSLINEKRLNLYKDAAFLNFNYTNTLERIYNTDPNNICYIHGNTGSNGLRMPVIGHGESSIKGKVSARQNEIRGIVFNYEKCPTWANSMEDFFDVIVKEIVKLISDLKKKTDDCIDEHKDWFDKLSNIREIYVLGHSLADVDAPYFLKIQSIALEAKWHVSYYGEKNRTEKQKAFCKIFRRQPQKPEYDMITLDDLRK